jgi:hypothetical protein
MLFLLCYDLCSLLRCVAGHAVGPCSDMLMEKKRGGDEIRRRQWLGQKWSRRSTRGTQAKRGSPAATLVVEDPLQLCQFLTRWSRNSGCRPWIALHQRLCLKPSGPVRCYSCMKIVPDCFRIWLYSLYINCVVYLLYWDSSIPWMKWICKVIGRAWISTVRISASRSGLWHLHQ